MSYSAQRIEAYERKPVIHPYTPQHSSRSPHPPFRTPQQNDTASGQVDPNDTAWTSQQGFPSSSALFPRFSQWSEEKVATLQARLSRKLGPEYVTQRPGPSGGPKLRLVVQWTASRLKVRSYIEGWKGQCTCDPYRGASRVCA